MILIGQDEIGWMEWDGIVLNWVKDVPRKTTQGPGLALTFGELVSWESCTVYVQTLTFWGA